MVEPSACQEDPGFSLFTNLRTPELGFYGREVSRSPYPAQNPSEKRSSPTCYTSNSSYFQSQHRSPKVSYDKAQICSNGHIITADIGRLRGSGMEKFCSRCGAETL